MSDEYDVVVVGGGGAGLACAVSAAEQGARVVIVEKRPQLGGSTGRAIGSFTSAGTSFQKRAGIDDNPVDHDVDAGLFGPREYEARNNVELRRFFFNRSAQTLDWLTSLGLAFQGPSPEPPNRVPRMHNVVPNAKAYVAVLQARLVRLHGAIVCNAQVTELVRESGRVVGVVAKTDGRTRVFRARLGVVLAAGDYTNSTAMITKYRGARFAAVEGLNPDAMGEGHLLAEAVGAKLVNMDITYGPEFRFVAPTKRGVDQLLPSGGPLLRIMGMLMPLVPKAVINWMVKRLLVSWQHPEDALLMDGAILVNRAGLRFCDESVSPEREIAVAAQTDGVAYLVLDERLATLYSAWPHYISTAPEIAYAYVPDYLKLRRDVTIERSDLRSLAIARGLPPDSLTKTVERFNAMASSGSGDIARGGTVAALTGSRWVLMGPVKAYFTNSEGGASINESQEVLDTEGRPIAGLYAAGQTGLGGMVLWGHGLHIAWALTSGRLLGQALGRAATSK